MARICYCMKCESGEKELLNKIDSEEFNGLADVHFVSKSDSRWNSYDWTGLSFMGPEHLINRVMARKIEQFGPPPADLQVHACEVE